MAAAMLALLSSAGPAGGVPPDEALLPLEEYATPKSRALAIAHRGPMLELSQHFYHCVPWVEVQKHGIGFRSPKGAVGDDRYFTVWIWIEQGEDPGFAAMGAEQRASGMLSRYGVPLLRRMASVEPVAADPGVDGFAVVLSWLKPGRGRPRVNETLVAFVDRGLALAVAASSTPPAEIGRRARLSLFDGATELTRPRLEVWDDPFLGTYRPKDYTPPAGARC
jgi:hypothetical protein